MRDLKLKVFFALIMLVAMLFARFAVGPVKAPFTLKIKERQITTNIELQDFPAVYGSIIVWEDLRNGNYDIYMYDLSTSTETRITTNTAFQEHPDVYGNIIVWEEWPNDLTDADIYMYDLSTSTETRITNTTVDEDNPAVYGNVIVWQDDRNGNYDIYMAELLRSSDINIDGRVDIKDLAMVAKWFGKTVPPAPINVDINYDDTIDMKDLASVAKDYGKIDP